MLLIFHDRTSKRTDRGAIELLNVMECIVIIISCVLLITVIDYAVANAKREVSIY
jgi:hypothetical protein